MPFFVRQMNLYDGALLDLNILTGMLRPALGTNALIVMLHQHRVLLSIIAHSLSGPDLLNLSYI